MCTQLSVWEQTPNVSHQPKGLLRNSSMQNHCRIDTTIGRETIVHNWIMLTQTHEFHSIFEHKTNSARRSTRQIPGKRHDVTSTPTTMTHARLWINTQQLCYAILPIYLFIFNSESITHISITFFSTKWLSIKYNFFLSLIIIIDWVQLKKNRNALNDAI